MKTEEKKIIERMAGKFKALESQQIKSQVILCMIMYQEGREAGRAEERQRHEKEEKGNNID